MQERESQGRRRDGRIRAQSDVIAGVENEEPGAKRCRQPPDAGKGKEILP